MKTYKYLILTLLLMLSSCTTVDTTPPENEDIPHTVTIQTEKNTFTGILTIEDNVRTWQITEPENIAGMVLTCTETGCTVSVDDVVIPLDAQTAAYVWQMLVE